MEGKIGRNGSNGHYPEYKGESHKPDSAQDFLESYTGEHPFKVLNGTELTISQGNGVANAYAHIEVDGQRKLQSLTYPAKSALDAFDGALKNTLSPTYPSIERVTITEVSEERVNGHYTVGVEFKAGDRRWVSVRQAATKEEAGVNALVDGYTYFLLQKH